MLVSSMARVASMGRMLPEEALGGLEGVEEIVEPGVAVVTLGTVPVLHKGSEIRQVDELVVVDVHRLEDVEVSPHRLHQLLLGHHPVRGVAPRRNLREGTPDLVALGRAQAAAWGGLQIHQVKA